MSKGTYGAPRVHGDLADAGLRHGRKRVARLMRVAGLAGKSPRRWRTTCIRGPRVRKGRPARLEDGSRPAAGAWWGWSTPGGAVARRFGLRAWEGVPAGCGALLCVTRAGARGGGWPGWGVRRGFFPGGSGPGRLWRW
ncbi:IS3 family transposase [Actinoplanes sp. NPDC026619]|uniref:IS3 family transposase n=1 Tax=Actinoplanes sp. NPDC026619 TaxID=3155798 RepID=UPI0033C92876